MEEEAALLRATEKYEGQLVKVEKILQEIAEERRRGRLHHQGFFEKCLQSEKDLLVQYESERGLIQKRLKKRQKEIKELFMKKRSIELLRERSLKEE